MPSFEAQMRVWGRVVSAGVGQAALLHESEPFPLISHINYPGRRERRPLQQKPFTELSEVI